MMCAIDYAEPCEVSRSSTVRARKEHLCDECRRTIQPGESYTNATFLFEGGWFTFKICAHCEAAASWLNKHCGGWVFGSVLEDLEEHWEDEYRVEGIGRRIVGIRRGWRGFNGELMKVPANLAQ